MINAKVRRTNNYADGSGYLEVHIKKSEVGDLPFVEDTRVDVTLIAGNQVCRAGLRMTASNDYAWICPDVYVSEKKVRLADFLSNIDATANTGVLLEFRNQELHMYNSQKLIDSLPKGVVLDNKKLCELFYCSTQGGMRRSHSTNTLVIVSNHIQSIYDDRWINNIFHYTGMGTKANQNLNFAQNRTLAESEVNGVKIHLFEVFVERKYTYMGRVQLSDSPYFEKQLDQTGAIRDVCIFPLKLVDDSVPAINLEYVQKSFELKIRKARNMSNEEVRRRAQNSKKSVGLRPVVSQRFDRDPWVAENAKRDANGICQLCEVTAPFLNEFNEPFLETHHIKWLASGGEDTIENTVALCPNCHRRMHVLNDEKDINLLIQKKLVLLSNH